MQEKISNSVLAFRGYNVTNLGRTRELLEVPAYREALLEHLEIASSECARHLGQPVDLTTRVMQNEEPPLHRVKPVVNKPELCSDATILLSVTL